MTATAFALDPTLDDNTAPAFSEPAMDRWFGEADGRPKLQVIEGAALVEVPAASIDPMVEVYRRRRFAVALALTAVILLVVQLTGLSLTSFGPTPSTADASTPVVHVVRPGDTYAGIAADLGVDDPDAFASELRLSNGGGELVIGDRLVMSQSSLG